MVLFETENNFSFPFAISCGVKAEPVYGDVDVEKVDPDSGEVTYVTENRIIDYEGENLIYFDSEILADRYGNFDYSQGKETSKKRKMPVIEDIARCMNEFLDAQDEGKIQQPILFIWDSVGSIPSYRSFTSKANNAMWDAGALSTSFNILLNNRIPSSKKVSNPYTNTFVAVNKIWVDSMSAPMAAPSLKLKGGNAFLYASRLTILLGGKISAGTRKLDATTKGAKYTYGLVTKIKVEKNQLDAPYGLTYEGTFCCVPDGMVSEGAALDQYKKDNVSKILDQLKQQIAENGGNADDVSEGDIVFEETDSEE